MDTMTLALVVLALTLLAAAGQAWRLENEARDIVLLSACGGVLGAGAALSAAL